MLTLDDTGRRVVKTTRLTDDGSDPAVSPNGQRLAFASDRDGDLEVYVMRTDVPEGPNNRPRQLTFNQTYRDTAPNWSPGGSNIVFARRDALGTTPHNSDIFVMNADGTGKKNLTRSPELDGDPAFSPDGRFIAYGRDRDLWRMRADGTRPTLITAEGGQPDWQPLP